MALTGLFFLGLTPPLGTETKSVAICKGKKLVVGKGKPADLKQILQKGEYFQSLSSNFPVIDSAVMEDNVVFGFQMTVAADNAPSASGVLELIKALPAGKTLNLVWVKNKNGDFGCQLFRDLDKIIGPGNDLLKQVKQWRLKLEVPKQSPFTKV
jgi:hypothetical protein